MKTKRERDGQRKKPGKEREGDTIVRFLLLEPKGRKAKGRRMSDSSSYNLVLCLSKRKNFKTSKKYKYRIISQIKYKKVIAIFK